MVEDLYELVSKVDLYSGLQFGERFVFEVIVVLKGDFPASLVDFDDVGGFRIAITHCGARNVETKYCWK